MATRPAARSIHVEPDYGQFYLRRAGSAWQSDAVPSQGYERHLWSSGTFVMVGTVRKYGTTPLQVQVLDSEPELLPGDGWQHVVEESLEPGGDLEVLNWDPGEPVATVPIPQGPVRLRVSWAGLDEGNSFEGLDEDGNSSEHLLLQVWPQDADGASVLRCWPPLDLPSPTDRAADGRRQIEGLEDVLAQWDHLELVAEFSYPYPAFPGSMKRHSSTHAAYRDRRDGTLWADGYDVRRTLREVTPEETAALQRQNAEPDGP